ncbi:MAG: hypothetical protein JWQ43_649 [Glaciihabitans sp.]|nr:hypothetical protein [Glaciihabitans sp.]
MTIVATEARAGHTDELSLSWKFDPVPLGRNWFIMAKFHLEFDDVATYAALVYRLQSVTKHLDSAFGKEGEIIFPDRSEIETILSDGSVGRWAISTPASAIGAD